LKTFLFLILVSITNLHANPSINLFEGDYNYWSDSGDYDSLSIMNRDGLLVVNIKRNKTEFILECQEVLDELVSKEIQGIRYYFSLNGDNELRMRKEFVKTDRPEDIEWLFYRVNILKISVSAIDN
jgi:hypothetical protein